MTRRSDSRGAGHKLAGAALVGALLASSCGTAADTAVPAPIDESIADRRPSSSPRTSPEPVSTSAGTPEATTASTPSTTTPPATAPPATTTSVATTSTTTTTTSTTTSTTLPAAVIPGGDALDPAFTATIAVFDRLAASNTGASISVMRGGELVVTRASGNTLDGSAATGDTPMVVASVSKIVVAVGIARLAAQGRVDIGAPVPWADMDLDLHPGWADVTVRELLDHTSGLPKARASWFTGDGDCRSAVGRLLGQPPTADRGRWVYSNGNYCLLGLLIEQRSGLPLDTALQILVFDPIDADGIHLTTSGLLPGDLPHREGTARLSRLGGAGQLVVSSDDLAAMLARTTEFDLATLLPPGVFTDQYGFGHTGTVTGAKSCVWVLEGGATVVAATIAGNSVSTGGDVCDLVVPAVAADLGIGAGRPDRTP